MQRCFAKNFRAGESWLSGVITKSIGSKSFEIELNNGSTIRRHIDHPRPRACTPQVPPDNSTIPDFPDEQPAGPQNEATEPTGVALRRTPRVSVPPDRYITVTI